jgi:hypothetical protein
MVALVACGGMGSDTGDGSAGNGGAAAMGQAGNSANAGSAVANAGAAQGNAGAAQGNAGAAQGNAGAAQGNAGAPPANAGAGGTSNGSTIGSTDPSGVATLPNGRGAIMPFTEYEAEAGTLKGGAALLGPSRNTNSTNDIAAEASGRKAVRLNATNDGVEIKNLNPSNSIVVRYSIPDSGLDYSTTLSVYVDGTFKQKLKVTSRYSWAYGGPNDFANLGVQKNPGAGSPHHFFDEAHAIIGNVPVGSAVRVQKDADDGAAHYDIDLIDMEQVPDAPAKPAGFLSLADCGGIPNDDKDDTAAFNKCLNSSKNIFIPEGVFTLTTKELSVQAVTIRGSGMWRSTLKGFFARFDCFKSGCKFYDFMMDGDTTHRDDSAPETAFTGNGMSGSVIEHVWVEHKKVGIWPGDNTNGLTIRNSRFRDLFADGVNLACGTSNALVEHVHARNTGDDAFAAWSLNKCAANHDNTFKNVYAQLPWRANCFGIYGGSSSITNSVCSDTPEYPGVLLGTMFDSNAFGDTKVTGVTLIRTGGPQYGEQGALKLNAEQQPIQHITVSDVDIQDSTFSGVHLAGKNIDAVSFSNVKISGGGCGILAQGPGAADMANVTVSGAGSPLCNEKGFNFIKGAGNSGW